MLEHSIEFDDSPDRSRTSMEPWSSSLTIWSKRFRIEFWIESDFFELKIVLDRDL